MNTHQQPSTKEWVERLEAIIAERHGGAGLCDHLLLTTVYPFIQSLLTSHSEAMRERVEGMRKTDPNKVPPFPKVEYTHLDVFGYNQALDDILALLNDIDV